MVKMRVARKRQAETPQKIAWGQKTHRSEIVAVPRNRSFQAFSEIDRRRVAKDFPGLGDIREGITHIAWARRPKLGRYFFAQCCVDAVDQVEEADAVAAGDVEHFSRGVARGAGF